MSIQEEQIQELLGCGYPSRLTYITAIKRTYERLQLPYHQAEYDPQGHCTTCGEAGRCPGWHLLLHHSGTWPISHTQRAYALHMAASDLNYFRLEATLKDQLSQGDTIRETIGECITNWSLTMSPAPFIPASMTADYLASHLTARHKGFETILESIVRNPLIKDQIYLFQDLLVTTSTT